MSQEFKSIKEEEFVRRNNLLEQFHENGIEKAISEEDFVKKYGQGHEIFTMPKINQFVATATKDGVSDEIVKGIEDQLSTLSKVVVKTENGYESRYIREVKAEDNLSKGEGSKEEEEKKAEGEEKKEGEEEKKETPAAAEEKKEGEEAEKKEEEGKQE